MSKAPWIAGITVVVTIIGGLGGLKALGFTRPAFMSDFTPVSEEITELKKFSAGTRGLMLNAEWWRLQEKLDGVRNRLEDAPRDVMLKDQERRLLRNQGDVQRQIDQLAR